MTISRLDYGCIGCFTCFNFKSISDHMGVKGQYWCKEYEKVVPFLSRESCFCVAYKKKPEFCSRYTCEHCLDFPYCDALNVFNMGNCNPEICVIYERCRMRLNEKKDEALVCPHCGSKDIKKVEGIFICMECFRDIDDTEEL